MTAFFANVLAVILAAQYPARLFKCAARVNSPCRLNCKRKRQSCARRTIGRMNVVKHDGFIAQ